VYQILHTEPRDPLQLRSDRPPVEREVFVRLLAKSPGKRPAGAKEFLREVGAIQEELGKRASALESAEETVPLEQGKEAPPPSRPAMAYLLAAAAVLLAAAILVAIWRRTGQPAGNGIAPRSVGAVPTAARPEPTAALVEAQAPAPAPVETMPPLPTRGPREAAAASVGAPRSSDAVSRERPAAAARAARAQPPPAPEPPEASVSAGPPAENVYRTRRVAKFGVSPDQARIFLDGRYVGVADDWDDHGGGKTLESAGRDRTA